MKDVAEILKDAGVTHAEFGLQLGESESWVYRRLRNVTPWGAIDAVKACKVLSEIAGREVTVEVLIGKPNVD